MLAKSWCILRCIIAGIFMLVLGLIYATISACVHFYLALQEIAIAWYILFLNCETETECSE